MESNWATENLQVIRTLMERSALYRRALAPMLLAAGALGMVAGVAGWQLKIMAGRPFVLFWLLVSAVAVALSFFLVRRQALKDGERVWSGPTRRVAHAMTPAIAVGAVISLIALGVGAEHGYWVERFLPPIWMILYGLAAHSAGFFMERGIRLLGILFVLAGLATLGACGLSREFLETASGHLLMGGSFGFLHLLCGGYLYFTEKGKSAT